MASARGTLKNSGNVSRLTEMGGVSHLTLKYRTNHGSGDLSKGPKPHDFTLLGWPSQDAMHPRGKVQVTPRVWPAFYIACRGSRME